MQNTRAKIKAAAVLLAALTSSYSYSAEPIKIGVSGPFTGGSAPMGVSMRDGIRLAISEINAAGGLLGRQIVAVERDDEAKNERGVQIAQELINKEGVAATVGYVNTGVGLASQRFYQDAKIPVMSAVTAGTVITRQFLPPAYPDNYIFRTAASDSLQSAIIVDIVRKNNWGKVAILADSTNYGQLGKEDLEKALAKFGMKPVAVEKFNIKDVDMTPQLLKARAAGAQAILTYGIGPELAQIANGMQKLGWKVPMVGSWTLSMANFIDNAGKNGDGALMPQTFIQESDTPVRKRFIDSYLRTYSSPMGRIPSAVSAAQGYDAMQLLAAAIRQAGTTDGVKVRMALENLQVKVPGVIAEYDKPFTHDDHEAIKAEHIVIGQVQSGRVVRAR